MSVRKDRLKVKVALQNASKKQAAKTALLIDRALIFLTPVDTGRAQSNWLPGIGAPSRAVVDQPDISGNTAVSAMEAALNTLPNYPVIYISNNLPYIRRLNEGSSSQAPAAFVESAVAQGVGAS